MTGRTHDLAAFTAMSYVLVTTPLEQMTLATAIVAFSVNMIGGLAPDLDQSTASLWKRVRAGTFLSRVITPLFGGHRFISHSLLGVVLIGFILSKILPVIGNVLLVDMDIIWWSFMLGFISHLVMDMFTKEGIPLFFPFPLRVGIPPLAFLRIKTGGLVEKSFIFPGLILLNGYIYFTNYSTVLDFLKLLQ